MRTTNFLAGLLSLAPLVIGSAVASAAPLPPMKPVTIEGTIAKAQWTPETKVAGRPGFSGSLGVDHTVPAHFRIELVDFRGLSTDLAWRLNGIMSDPTSSQTERENPPPHLVLQLNEKNPHALMKGMRIRVGDYVVSGDEGGTWTRFTKLEILSRPPGEK